ncbi:MAG: hypothetical protein V1736_00195 [Pseudomonadota bacterium]
MGFRIIKQICLLCIVLLFCCACSGRPVTYLASDACLIKKQETTQKDVLALLGKPHSVESRSDDLEIWYYYNVAERLVNKIPYIGERLATKEIETIKIDFKKQIVSDCCYTLRSEK